MDEEGVAWDRVPRKWRSGWDAGIVEGSGEWRSLECHTSKNPGRNKSETTGDIVSVQQVLLK